MLNDPLSTLLLTVMAAGVPSDAGSLVLSVEKCPLFVCLISKEKGVLHSHVSTIRCCLTQLMANFTLKDTIYAATHHLPFAVYLCTCTLFINRVTYSIVCTVV